MDERAKGRLMVMRSELTRRGEYVGTLVGIVDIVVVVVDGSVAVVG